MKTQVVSLAKRFLRRVPRSVFETKCALWNVRDLRTHRLTVRPDLPVVVDFSSFDETLEWIKTLDIPELLDPRDREIALRERHWWGNAKLEERTIGCIKICVRKAYIPDFKKILEIPEKVSYVTDIYVLPEFRGNKVGAYLNDCACDWMKGRGFEKQISFNEEWNTAARKADSRVRREVKRIRYLRILSFKWFTTNPSRL